MLMAVRVAVVVDKAKSKPMLIYPTRYLYILVIMTKLDDGRLENFIKSFGYSVPAGEDCTDRTWRGGQP